MEMKKGMVMLNEQKDQKTNFGNINCITGSTIQSTFEHIAQEHWDSIFGNKPKKERYVKTEYDNEGNEIYKPNV
jgi:hypothetical protein